MRLILVDGGKELCGVNALEAAVQLRLAYEHFKRPAKFINPTMAQERYERIHYGGRPGFANPRASEP